jgi:5-histidylcysteine sulfoxide synthase
MMNSHQFSHPPKLDNCDRQSLLDYLEDAWRLEDNLMKSLVGDQTFYLNPDPMRNPLIFYLGHSANFYINKLICVELLAENLNPQYTKLFGVGVDPENPQALSQSNSQLNWPEVSQVWLYREKVHEIVLETIKHTPIDLPIHQDHPLWAVMMAIEHQRIHVETSSVLIRQLPVAQVKCPANWKYAPTNTNIPYNKMIEVVGGKVEIGKSGNSSTYGWDIEYGVGQVEVPSFLASQYLVTNADFWEFVKLGGYTNQAYWDEPSWLWKTEHDITHPKFWIPSNGSYKYRAMFDELELPLDWPVEVNHYEAMAYCRWSGERSRLMSEPEWHLANFGAKNCQNNHEDDDSTNNYNLNLQFGSPTPVGLLNTAKSCSGLYDLRGNVWELLKDHLQPLSGFQPHPLYLDNSAPFCDTKHNMLLGGAWITNGTEALTHYRNWFRPHIYQHAGFRIVQDYLN